LKLKKSKRGIFLIFEIVKFLLIWDPEWFFIWV